jgi:preprotein translocase subunit SecE
VIIVATQENAPNKPVHLMYLCGALVLFYLTQWSIDWLWGYFVRPPSELVVTAIAGIVTVFAGVSLYRNDRVYTLANEVSAELKKVTWPAAKEVRAATIVVILMAIVAAIILGLVFDGIFSNLTELIYG